MDPFSALGLAGNIITFIDFSSKLVSAASKVHQSVSGLPEDLEDAAAVTKSLQALLDRLPATIPPPSASASDRALAELTINCRKTCVELQKLVQIVKGKGSSSRADSFRVAWRGSRQKGKLRDLEKRLDSYRSFIMDHIQRVFQ